MAPSWALRPQWGEYRLPLGTLGGPLRGGGLGGAPEGTAGLTKWEEGGGQAEAGGSVVRSGRGRYALWPLRMGGEC